MVTSRRRCILFPETVISCRMPKCSNQTRGSSLKFIFACRIATSLALSNMSGICNQLWLILDLEKISIFRHFSRIRLFHPSHVPLRGIHKKHQKVSNSDPFWSAVNPLGGARCSGGDESSQGRSSGRGNKKPGPCALSVRHAHARILQSFARHVRQKSGASTKKTQ